MNYQLTFAGVPFTLDEGKIVRMKFPHPDITSERKNLPPEKHQPEVSLLDEIERKLSYKYLQDFTPAYLNYSKELNSIPFVTMLSSMPDPQLNIGDWYYPNTMSRFSIFRGLATSSMVAAMLTATQGSSYGSFVMRSVPTGPFAGSSSVWTVNTHMYMLPARPLGETGGAGDGLYLVTLVDDRYFSQSTPASLKLTLNTTWENLLTQLAISLDISLTYSSIESAYYKPEIDSQLFCTGQSASMLLDAVAWNLGRVVVRKMDGSYALYRASESKVIVNNNRGPINNVVRLAGGDIFNSGGNLRIGNLQKQKNAVIPSHVDFYFPKYVVGNSPVPHFMNERYSNQRPSSWNEDSYGSEFVVTVPITSGGSSVSGLTGTNQALIRSTAKAWMSTEADSTPINASGLVSLSLQLSKDLYENQVIAALDEVYPGTLNWSPEGIHDVIWSYSARRRLASTRVMKTEWDKYYYSTQHSAIPPNGYSNVPPGCGGKSVALTVRDSQTSNPYVSLSGMGAILSATDLYVSGRLNQEFPTDQRWKGRIESEDILFEGTSGIEGFYSVVYRGIDGTIAASHNPLTPGIRLQQLTPSNNYGTNLITYEKGEYVFPGIQTSGGISEVKKIPQTQTVKVNSYLSGQTYGQGSILYYNPQNDTYETGASIYVKERDSNSLTVGKKYDGQFAKYGGTEARPIYLVSDAIASLESPNTGVSGKCATVYVQETDPRCESGKLNIYKRDIRLYFESGCFKDETLDWYFSRQEGCCACSGFGSAISGATSGCVPGTCVNCTDPPASWNVFVNGFGGLCDVWNRNWILTPQSDCTWYASLFIDGLLTYIRIVVGGSTAILTFGYGPEIEQVYTKSLIDFNCCQPFTFTLDGDCVCTEGPGIPSDGYFPCPFCIDEITPESFSFSFTEFTGDYSLFNFTGTIPRTGTCIWEYNPSDNVQFAIYMTSDDRFIVLFQKLTSPELQVVYQQNISDVINCCSPMTIPLYSIEDLGVGTFPPTVTINPTCTPAPPAVEICPPTITAVPTCCTSGGGTVGTISTNCCPNNLFPETLYVTITTLGTFTLQWDESVGLTGGWKYEGILGTCENTVIVLSCSALDVWLMTVSAGASSPIFISCDPIELIFYDIDLTTCGGTESETFVVTE